MKTKRFVPIRTARECGPVLWEPDAKHARMGRVLLGGCERPALYWLAACAWPMPERGGSWFRLGSVPVLRANGRRARRVTYLVFASRAGRVRECECRRFDRTGTCEHAAAVRALIRAGKL